MKKLLLFVSIFFLVLITTSTVSAHGGRLNGEWCHNDYKAGTYHCHDEDGNIISSRDINSAWEKTMIQQNDNLEKEQEDTEMKEKQKEFRSKMKSLKEEYHADKKAFQVEYKEKKRELIQNYKVTLNKTIKKRKIKLENIPPSALPTIKKRIEIVINRILSDENKSEKKKESILAGIYALEEIINEAVSEVEAK